MYTLGRQFAASIGLSLLVAVTFSVSARCDDSPIVKLAKVPDEGIQPQIALGSDGSVHLIYFDGDPAAGDIVYRRLNEEDGASWSTPIRVNSQPNSAVAVGTIRGAHFALGKRNRVHVVWNGSGKAEPKGLPHPDMPEDNPHRLSAPMLYARMNVQGNAFEQQRNLMTHTYALDGGGSIAADQQGHVYVVWHANSTQGSGSKEGDRAVWVAQSADSGSTFAPEIRANPDDTGACGCCGLRAACDTNGRLTILYRTAVDEVHRDMHVLVQNDSREGFRGRMLSPWEASVCVMSSASIYPSQSQLFGAWETEKSIQFTDLNNLVPESKGAIPWTSWGGRVPHKHPSMATNSQGQLLLTWTEGTGWNSGGEVAWQVFDRDGKPIREARGRAKGLEAWNFPAAYVDRDGTFTILY